MSGLWRDLRFAVRMLGKSPGFSAAVVVALGLAMGVNTAVFGALNAFLMRSMPVVDADRLATVFMGHRDQPREWGPLSYLDYLDLRRENQVFSGLIASTGDGGSISDDRPRGQGERASTATWELVTGNAFDELGLRALAGRTLKPSDDTPAAEPVALISHALWRTRFRLDPAVIGRKVYLTNFPVTVVGVMPPDFKGVVPNGFEAGLIDAWLPLSVRKRMYRGTDDTFLTDRARRALFVYGHLQPGVTVAQATARLDATARVLAREHPATNTNLRIFATSEIEGRYGAQFAAVKLGFALALFSAALVLLISCANVANLLLARASRRRKELGIRVALGAGRGRIIRQLLTESVLLSLLGGGLGLLMAHWFGDLLHLFLPPMLFRLDLDLHADVSTLAWSFGAALLSGMAFGAAPAWRAARASVVTALKSDVGAEGQRRRAGLRQVLVVVQLAISIVVLASGGLLVRSLQKIKTIDPGFRVENLLTATVNPGLFTDDVVQQHTFFAELERRLKHHPGIQSVSSVRFMPLVNALNAALPVRVDGQVFADPSQVPSFAYSVAYRGYLQTAGTELLLGRDFHDLEHKGTPAVVMVNRELARRLFGSPEQALGRHLRVGAADSPPLQIIGVVRDGRYGDLLEEPRPWFCVPESLPWVPDAMEGLRTVLIRARDRTSLPGLLTALHNEVEAVDPRVPVEDPRLGDGQLLLSLYAPRLAAELGMLLGLLALALATMGIYSVMAYTVSQRTREIGIRMALGGQVADVLRLVLGQGMGLVAVGIGVGIGAALAVARLLRGFLVGVGAADPLTFGATVLLLTLVALLAVFIPARRATRVDPMVALRSQ